MRQLQAQEIKAVSGAGVVTGVVAPVVNAAAIGVYEVAKATLCTAFAVLKALI